MPTAGEDSCRVDLVVRGMHCGGCVANVERALRRVEGVRDARVNLSTERAVVELAAPRSDAVETLVAAVEQAGYEAAPQVRPREVVEQRQAARAADLRKRRRALIIGLIAGIPAIAVHFAGPLLGLGSYAAWLIEAGLTVIVLLAVAGEMMLGALRGLARGNMNMDLLVSLGALTAFVTGWVGVATGSADMVIFHAAALIVLFVGLGKFFEARARGQASGALEALMTRIPAKALRITDSGVESVPTEEVVPGDALRLTPHVAVPVDGELLSGVIIVDESMLTGESLPVRRETGDPVYGGTRISDGAADMKATATGAESAVARVAKLVEQAQESKPPWQRLADRVAGVFVPIVIILSVLTFAAWTWLGQVDTFAAVQRAIAVLVVACPCAMGLAIPTAVLVGTSRAAEEGMLVRDASALEAAGHVHEVLLDKTGTLTIGSPALETLQAAGGVEPDQILRLAASLERHSEHPLARAIVAEAERRGLTLDEPDRVRSQPGRGLAGEVDGHRVVVGTPAWQREEGGVTVDNIATTEDDRSAVYVTIDGKPAAVLRFSDPLHEEAPDAIGGLHAMGIRIWVLSGDREPAVRAIAEALGVDGWEAELTPQDKLERVRERVAAGVRVAMVGDGINDAPALAAADVGIAIGTGADVAREAADICLVGHSPSLIARVVRMSRTSARVMKQNLAWAFGYNIVMLPVAMITPIPPWAATAAMMLSSLSVVGNSLRLRRLI